MNISSIYADFLLILCYYLSIGSPCPSFFASFQRVKDTEAPRLNSHGRGITMKKDDKKKKFGDILFDIITSTNQKEGYPYLEPSELEAIKAEFEGGLNESWEFTY